MRRDRLTAAGYMDLFLGNIGGCIGETSALAIDRAAYLVIRKVITLEIADFYRDGGAVYVDFGGNTLFTGDFVFHILSEVNAGSLFMATDYSTSR